MRPKSFVSRITLLLLQVFVLSNILLRHTFALNVSEPPDFPNNAPGAPYALTNVGVHVFNGTVSGTDNQDRFDITIPAGLQLSQVTKNITGVSNGSLFLHFVFEDLVGFGSNAFVNPIPASPYPAGQYSFFANVNAGAGSVWTAYFYVTAAPDYAITNSGSSIIVKGLTGNNDTITITNSSFGNIKLLAPGRFISVNGATPVTGDSGELFYLGLTNVTFIGGSGNDTINLNLGNNSVSYPNMTIASGTGNNTLNINSTFFMATDANLNIDLTAGVGVINVASGVHVFATGTGNFTAQCSKNVQMASGSGFQVKDGDLTVNANQQTDPTPGNFTGVNLDGATFQSIGAGYVIVNGRGGDDSGGSQLGVQVINGAKIVGGTSGYVLLGGTGGNSGGIVNRGVTVYGTGSAVTTIGGSVSITGYSGTNSSFFGIGVSLLFGGQIGAGGAGSVSITGVGAGQSSSGFDQGLELAGTNSLIFSSGGNVSIEGIAGPGGSAGIYLANAGAIATPSTGGSVTLISDSVSLDPSTTVTTTNSGSSVTFETGTFGTTVDLGGADVAGNPATLGLTDAELDRVNTKTLFVGLNSGGVTISAPITHPYATNFTILPGLFGKLHPTVSGTDISLVNGGTVAVHFGAMGFPITGPTVDSGYPQLKVTGKVEINTASLNLAGSTYPGNVGDSFTLIDNDGSDAVVGTFNGLPEGGYVSIGGSPAQIHYSGGDGNDVVLVRANPQIFSAAGLTNGNWRVTGIGISSNTYTIQATTNFLTWTNIGFATGNVNGAFSFTDTNAFRFRYRFYRSTN